MSSVALSCAQNSMDAKASVEAMLVALEDRAPQWTVMAIGGGAVGSGAVDGTTARRQLRTIPALGATVAIDAPAWLLDSFDLTLRRVRAKSVSAADDVADLFATMTGDVHCVAVLDSGDGVAYRGPASSRPLFYATSGGSLVVASRTRGIRATYRAGVDVPGLAPFLVPQLCDPAASAWSGIRRLPPGCALIWHDGKVSVRRVSEVAEQDIGSASREDLVQEFRVRLLTAIERCSGPPDVLLLSGGIDSSSLACAHTALGVTGSSAFALTYDESLAPCDERRYVDDVEAATGMPVHRLDGTRLLPLIADYPDGDEPEPWAYAARNWALLGRIVDDPIGRWTTVIAGEGGDELLLGQVFTVADRIALGDSVGGQREICTFPDPERTRRVVDGLLAGDYDRLGTRKLRALDDVPPWLSNRYVAETGLVEALADGYPRLGEPGRMATNYSRELIAEAGAAGRVQCGGWWEDMGRQTGVAITYPFLDPDLASLVWSLPPYLLRDRGLEKVVLREALRDELPESVARRDDKAQALALMHAGLREEIDQVRQVGYGGPLVDHGVIDPQKLRVSIDRYLAGALNLAPALWATVAVDRWMTAQPSSTREGVAA